jgi:hypothetical protein
VNEDGDPSGKSHGTLEKKLDDFASWAEDDPETAREYTWKLVDTIKETSSAIKRSYISIVLLALLFVLLDRGLVDEASVMGIKFSKVGFIIFALPIVIAFTFYRLVIHGIENEINKEVYYGITRRTYPGLASSYFDTLIQSSPSIGSSGFPEDLLPRNIRRFSSWSNNVETITVVFILPLGVVLYEAVQLFRSSESPYLAATISTMLSVMLLSTAYVFALRF